MCFIDSDDYVASDYIEYLSELLKENNADISSCQRSDIGRKVKKTRY